MELLHVYSYFQLLLIYKDNEFFCWQPFLKDDFIKWLPLSGPPADPGLLPWGGCKVSDKNGGPGEILHFWTQFMRFGAYFLPTLYWKPLYLFPIKNVKYHCYYYGKPMKIMGHFIYPLVPPGVPHSLLTVYMLFCHWGIRCSVFKQTMLYCPNPAICACVGGGGGVRSLMTAGVA